MNKARRKIEDLEALINDAQFQVSEAMRQDMKVKESVERLADALLGRKRKPSTPESVSTHPFLVTINGDATCKTHAQVESLVTSQRDHLVAHVPSSRLYIPRSLMQSGARDNILQLRPSLINILATAMRHPRTPFGHQNVSPLSHEKLTAPSLRTLVWEITRRLKALGLSGRILSRERVARSQSTTGWGFALCPYWRYAVVEMRDVDSSDDSLNRPVDSAEGQITQ